MRRVICACAFRKPRQAPSVSSSIRAMSARAYPESCTCNRCIRMYIVRLHLMHKQLKEPTMAAQLRDKVVVITGGGGGIGKAAARRFLDGGGRVVLSGTRQAVLDAARDELDPSGERVEIVAGRITGREQAHELIGAAVARFGGVDVLVNSTGIFRIVPFLDQTEEHLEEALG